MSDDQFIPPPPPPVRLRPYQPGDIVRVNRDYPNYGLSQGQYVELKARRLNTKVWELVGPPWAIHEDNFELVTPGEARAVGEFVVADLDTKLESLKSKADRIWDAIQGAAKQ